VLTVRSLLEEPALELRLLVPGPPGALERPVVWVHNTELPDPSTYLREGELVLTNGLWLGQVTPDVFVRNVVRGGAAGIVFGLRAETRKTPAELVAACRAAGLPLVEISPAVPFTAVSEAVAARYTEERQRSLVGRVRRGDALAMAISRGAGASGVLRVLRQEHDLPLAVADRRGRLLATAGIELDAGRSREVGRAAGAALARRPPPLEIELGAAGTATLFLVGAVGDVDAALLCLRPAHALSAAEKDALEQAARFLTLEVAKQQAVQAIELRFAGELLEMVLSGGHRAGEVRERLRAFGVDADGPLAVCAVAFAPGGGPGRDDAAPPAPPGPAPRPVAHPASHVSPAGSPAGPPGGSPASAHPAPHAGPYPGAADDAATLPGLAETVGELLTAEAIPAVVADGSQDVVAVLSWRRPEPELKPLLERLVATVSERFSGRRAVAGLGGFAPRATGLREPLLRAREACRALRRRRTGPAVRGFAELGTYRLLLALQDSGTLHGLADAVLGPLREHDARRGGELETTLRAFLDHDGQWAATAAALHIHVNTLRNRLTKIAELTGKDVSRTEDRVDLFLALEASAMG